MDIRTRGGGLSTHPWIPTPPDTYPREGTWKQRYPPPGKDMGPDISTPCEQTYTCENITFRQLRLRAVTYYFCHKSNTKTTCFGFSFEGFVNNTTLTILILSINSVFQFWSDYQLFMGHINFYRPQRSCGQGYVFTRVCDSVNTPRRRLLLRTVRILLECILV